MGVKKNPSTTPPAATSGAVPAIADAKESPSTKENPSITVVIALIAALWTAFSTNWQAMNSFNDDVGLILGKKFPSGEDIPKERRLGMLDDVRVHVGIFVVVNLGFAITLFALPLLVTTADRNLLLIALCWLWALFFLIASILTFLDSFSEFQELEQLIQ